jgi:hypothetical protein
MNGLRLTPVWCRRRLLFLLPICGLAPLRAQWAPEVEGLQRFRLRTFEPYLELKVEAQDDQRTNRGEPVRRTYVFVEPVLGVDLRGSVYHPNLLEFHLKPEFGLSHQGMKLDPPGGIRYSEKFLQRYDARVELLRAKPFATGFFLERGRTYRDLDFFSRAQVDSSRYGGNTGYRTGKVPFSLDAMRVVENVGGDVRRASEVTGTTVTLNASVAENRKHRTDFTYVLDAFDRRQEGVGPTVGTSSNASLRDSLTWGSDDRCTLNSNGLFHRVNSNTSHNRSVTVQEGLLLHLRPSLNGDVNYGLSDSRAEEVASRSHEGGFALQHQLYRSLSSRLAVLGETLATHGGGTRLATDRRGTSLDENYTKTLPGQSQLSLNAGWRGDLHRRHATGQVLGVSNEVVTLSDRKPVFLAHPHVSAVSRVTDVFSAPYLEGLDYVLIPHAALMEIRRVPGGRIPEGGQVLVNYLASVPPSDDYSTVAQSYQARLDLWQGVVALYGRLTKVDNYGGESVVLRNLADRVLGLTVNWRGLAVGAERERQNSNLSPFHSDRTFQSLVLDLGVGTTLALDGEQSSTRYPDTGRTRQSRALIARYQQRLGAEFTAQLEGGVRRERGLGFDQDRAAARAALRYVYGKLAFSFSYDFEDENLQGELHRRQYVRMHVKRTF